MNKGLIKLTKLIFIVNNNNSNNKYFTLSTLLWYMLYLDIITFKMLLWVLQTQEQFIPENTIQRHLLWKKGGADLDHQLRWPFLLGNLPQSQPASPSSWRFDWVWAIYLPEVKRWCIRTTHTAESNAFGHPNIALIQTDKNDLDHGDTVMLKPGTDTQQDRSLLDERMDVCLFQMI